MGLKRWFAERWADFKYDPPVKPKISKEMNWRTAVDFAWISVGVALIATHISIGFGALIFGVAFWDWMWAMRVTTLNMSPKQIRREFHKRLERPKGGRP